MYTWTNNIRLLALHHKMLASDGIRNVNMSTSKPLFVDPRIVITLHALSRRMLRVYSVLFSRNH